MRHNAFSSHTQENVSCAVCARYDVVCTLHAHQHNFSIFGAPETVLLAEVVLFRTFFVKARRKPSVIWLQASDHRVCGGSELCTLFGVSRRETVNQPCPYLLHNFLLSAPHDSACCHTPTTHAHTSHTDPLDRSTFTAGTRRHPRVRTHIRGKDGHFWRPHKTPGGGRLPPLGQSCGHRLKERTQVFQWCGGPLRWFSVGGDPEQDVKRLPWRVVLPCRYGWSCWRPGCVHEHDQGWDRQDVVELRAEAAAVSGCCCCC